MKKYNREAIGEEYETTKGYKVKIVDGGEKPSYCTIRFLINGTEKQAQYAAVKSGFVKMEGYEKLYGKDKVGEKHLTNEGFQIEVVAPGTKRSHVIIEFKEPKKYREEVQYCTVKLGTIRNVYKKTGFNVGYIGEGKYQTTIKAYTVWRNILMRCYDEQNKYFKKYGGVGIKVCEEWLCYQTFAKWYEENKIEDWEVDKDLLSKGNDKNYSPDNCCFLPKSLNIQLQCSQKKNKYGAIGVSKEGQKWRADFSTMYLGAFHEKKEAELAYLEAKRIKMWESSKKYSEKMNMTQLELFRKIFPENILLKKIRKEIKNPIEIKTKILEKTTKTI